MDQKKIIEMLEQADDSLGEAAGTGQGGLSGPFLQHRRAWVEEIQELFKSRESGRLSSGSFGIAEFKGL